MGGLLHRGNKTHQGQLCTPCFHPSSMIRTPHTCTRTSHRNGRILAKTAKILLWHPITKRVAKKSALVFSSLIYLWITSSYSSSDVETPLRNGRKKKDPVPALGMSELNWAQHPLPPSHTSWGTRLCSPYHPLPSSRELHSMRGRSSHCEENHPKLSEGLWLFQLSSDSLQQLLKNTEKGILYSLVFLSHLLSSHQTAPLTIFKQW